MINCTHKHLMINCTKGTRQQLLYSKHSYNNFSLQVVTVNKETQEQQHTISNTGDLVLLNDLWHFINRQFLRGKKAFFLLWQQVKEIWVKATFSMLWSIWPMVRYWWRWWLFPRISGLGQMMMNQSLLVLFQFFSYFFKRSAHTHQLYSWRQDQSARVQQADTGPSVPWQIACQLVSLIGSNTTPG